MSSTKPLLVLGATGKQGKKVIETILASDSKANFTILALTRNPDSASAKALAAKSTIIKLVKGNLDDTPNVFKAALEASGGAPIWGIFSVQQAVQDGATQDTETKQGKAVVDQAIAHNVKIFVYTSVDRGGDKSESNPTYVPHFISKHDIEAHLKAKAADAKMQYTILRPVAFMDGLTPNFMGKVFATFIKVSAKPSKPVAFIATSDIGFFAGQAFLQPENPDYRNKAISLAGDELTFGQMSQVFRERLGYEIPTTFEFLARFIKWMVSELGIMFKWFDEEGFTVDIPKLKRMNPGLKDFGTWMETESGFPKK
ncbi:MAG: hypothetical protein ALECFALPRED_006510 [Alectoria fallacina]|uniref:NmrA-like domain-containing protein n=1 Tax=Alectoria fallacina TaxID=1903189 RepID=A0A8H3G6U7_9LECA|nr:MAG: hypothetical protein ALECFALPRED_006510 [Alectoria fallacina]